MAPHEVIEEPSSSSYTAGSNVESLKKLAISSTAHPLDPLSISECDRARQAILNVRGPEVLIKFRAIYMYEPPKRELVAFLEAEHSNGLSTKTPRPARQAYIQYDVISKDGAVQFTESIVDVMTGKEALHRPIGKPHHAALTSYVGSMVTFLVSNSQVQVTGKLVWIVLLAQSRVKRWVVN